MKDIAAGIYDLSNEQGRAELDKYSAGLIAQLTRSELLASAAGLTAAFPGITVTARSADYEEARWAISHFERMVNRYTVKACRSWACIRTS